MLLRMDAFTDFDFMHYWFDNVVLRTKQYNLCMCTLINKLSKLKARWRKKESNPCWYSNFRLCVKQSVPVCAVADDIAHGYGYCDCDYNCFHYLRMRWFHQHLITLKLYRDIANPPMTFYARYSGIETVRIHQIHATFTQSCQIDDRYIEGLDQRTF